MKRRSFSVSEFKSKSLGLFEEISRSGETLVVTKRGKPIAEIRSVRGEQDQPLSGRLKGTLLSEGDLLTPFGAELWKAAEPTE